MEQTVIPISVEPALTRHPKLSEITSMPKPRYRSHWALLTRDLDTYETFYRTLTGASRICKPQECSSALTWDHEHHRFFLGHREGMLAMFIGSDVAKIPSPYADEHIGEAGGGIRFATPRALVRVLERMKAIGREPTRILDRGAVVSVVYRDPEGLVVDAFAPVAGVPSKAEVALDQKTFTERFG